MKDNFYKQIDVALPQDIDIFKLRGEKITSYGKNPEISYYLIKDQAYFKTLFPELCKIPPSYIFYAEIIGAGNLWPHRDHNVSCCINFYFTSNDSTTYFYKETGDAWKYPGKSTANIYEFTDVEFLYKFKANENDTYLLNVSEIHSVTNPPPGIRRFITWQWTPETASYSEVLANLTYPVL